MDHYSPFTDTCEERCTKCSEWIDQQTDLCSYCAGIYAIGGYQGEPRNKMYESLYAEYPHALNLAKAYGWDYLSLRHGKVSLWAHFCHCELDFETDVLNMSYEDAGNAPDFCMSFPHVSGSMTLHGGVEAWGLIRFVEICEALVGRFAGKAQPVDVVNTARRAAWDFTDSRREPYEYTSGILEMGKPCTTPFA